MVLVGLDLISNFFKHKFVIIYGLIETVLMPLQMLGWEIKELICDYTHMHLSLEAYHFGTTQ